MKSIIYLYTEVMPYQVCIYKKLSELGFRVNVFFEDTQRQTPYEAPHINNVYYYKETSFSQDNLLRFINETNPQILVVCGWSNKKYLKVAKIIKKRKQIPVVCPIDSQVLGTIKQRIGFFISSLYIKTAFDYIWVSGVRQYEFARKLGYDIDHILMYSLSGNTDLFETANIDHKLLEYPKKLLFVGRFNEVKGLKPLLQAWNLITDKKGWVLHLVGNGPLESDIRNCQNVIVSSFMSQEELVRLTDSCGVFVLPSIYEPWALVLQEFAAAGLPILCSSICGASPHFVINNYNGYTFTAGDVLDMKDKILKMINLTPEDLVRMSERSRILSRYVDVDRSVASLLSILG